MKLHRIDNIKLSPAADEGELRLIAERAAGEKPAYFKILKKSLDARKKSDIHWVYSIEFGAQPVKTAQPERIKSDKKIIIAGGGPAGLFCAIRLIMRGFKPIVVERGDDVDMRAGKVRAFAEGGRLDTESNVQFGEGGAGTFSDGKLNTQTHRGRTAEVLRLFADFGAPAEVEYLNKPHIGSDNLPRVIKNMREFIISRGGEVRFGTKLTGIQSKNGQIKSVSLERGGERYTLPADALVLAVGHSARDTFEYLHGAGFTLEPRDFAVGVRIEHLQADINAAQYGGAAAALPPADYKLVSHAGERTCFTFCMCPGGVVVPAASERGSIVTNGMSNYARSGINANSGLLVSVGRADFGEGALAGMEFQRRLERSAYLLSGSYGAPAQTVGDFLSNRASASFGGVKPSFPGAYPSDIRAVLPPSVTDALALAIPDMAKRLRGFDTSSAVLTAPESRFSSPVRLLRGADCESVDMRGVYPCGEGCGYSGGITSSAADGLSVADAICERFK